MLVPFASRPSLLVNPACYSILPVKSSPTQLPLLTLSACCSFLLFSSLPRGVALLNSAGPLQDSDAPELAEPLPVPWYGGIRDGLTAVVKRVVLYFAFQRAKQPERIKEVLQMVYSSNGERAD